MIVLLSLIVIPFVIGAPEKHALTNECKFNNLKSGIYRCILTDEEVSFFVDCMVDGTMYINPGQQALYHYHKQAGLEMKFKLMESAEYNTEDDVNYENIEKLSENDGNIMNDQDSTINDDDSTINDEELTATEKHSVNLTAQYIVYGVIIFMALIFSVGICVLIYWWCCHHKKASDDSIKTNSFNNKLLDIDETAPFIDIRSSNTIKKQNDERIGKSIYFGMNENENLLLQRETNAIYDDINSIDDNEDGDDLIAHYGQYGATNSNHNSNSNENAGYVIAKYPNDDSM